MKSTKQVISAVENIEYYCKQIDVLAREQIQQDMNSAGGAGVNEEAFSARVTYLGIVGETTEYILTYCERLRENLELAEELDSKILNGE